MKITSEAVRTWAARALLAVVVAAPAAASWHGLSMAGEKALGLPGAWSALVPLVLDAGAAYTAVLALRDVLAGDATATNRMLVWVYAIGSAALNAWWADRSGGLPAALFYAAASISAVVLWDRTLRALRRDRLRELGAVQPPTPRFRLARWLVAPGETRRAWCLAVVEGITDPAEAVHSARALAGGDVADALPPVTADLAGLSKADAVRAAFEQLDEPTPREVAEWLAVKGVQVPPTYVSDVARRDAGKAITTDSGPLRLAAS